LAFTRGPEPSPSIKGWRRKARCVFTESGLIQEISMIEVRRIKSNSYLGDARVAILASTGALGILVYISAFLNRGVDFNDEAFHLAMMLDPQSYTYQLSFSGYLAHGFFGWLNPNILTFRFLGLGLNLLGSLFLFWGLSHWLRAFNRDAQDFVLLVAFLVLSGFAYYINFIRTLHYDSLNQFFVHGVGGVLLYALALGQNLRKTLGVWGLVFCAVGVLITLDFLVKPPTGLSLLVAALGTLALLYWQLRNWRITLMQLVGLLAGLAVGFGLFFSIAALNPEQYFGLFWLMVEMETRHLHINLLNGYAADLLRATPHLLILSIVIYWSGKKAGQYLDGQGTDYRKTTVRTMIFVGLLFSTIISYWVIRKIIFPYIWFSFIVVSTVVMIQIKARWIHHVSPAGIFAGLLLFSLPIGGSIGTGDPILYGTTPYLAAWSALLWIMFDKADRLMGLKHMALQGGVLSLGLIISCAIVFNYTYKTRDLGSLFRHDRTLPDVPLMKGMLIDAEQYSISMELRKIVSGINGFQEGDPVMFIYHNSMYPLIVGGRMPGFPWYFHQENRQVYLCKALKLAKFDPEKTIILRSQHPLHETFRMCLAEKGVVFPENYKNIGSAGDIIVYAPKSKFSH